jgi:ribonuclease HII
MPRSQIRQIGIDESARGIVLGSLTMAMVMVEDNSFWRRFASLPIRDSKKLTREQRDMIVARTEKYCYWRIHIIKPEIIGTENLNIQEARGIVILLNQVPKFWENSKIHIDNFEPNKEAFIKRFESVLTQNLTAIKDKFLYDKWKIEHHCDENNKICSLASIYAKHASDLEFDEIKEVWGNIGTGNPNDAKTLQFIRDNPDCPHVRKSNTTYKKLEENGELKTDLPKV